MVPYFRKLPYNPTRIHKLNLSWARVRSPKVEFLCNPDGSTANQLCKLRDQEPIPFRYSSRRFHEHQGLLAGENVTMLQKLWVFLGGRH